MSGYVQTIISNENGIILNHVTRHAKVLDAEIEVREMVSSLFESGMQFGGSFANIRYILIIMQNYQIAFHVDSKKPRFHDNYAMNYRGLVIR